MYTFIFQNVSDHLYPRNSTFPSVLIKKELAIKEANGTPVSEQRGIVDEEETNKCCRSFSPT